MDKTARPEVLLCDLDGVVWLEHQPIAGSVEALARARAAGIDVLFVTNASFARVEEVEAHLSRIGVDAVGRVVTSAVSAGTAVRPGWRVLVCGGGGLREEMARAGCDVVIAHENPGHPGPFDAVVVGLYREFDFGVLTDAMRAVRSGAMLIGSNNDNTYPTPNGPVPGGGAVLAAIATAAGVDPVVTGKPNSPMVELVRSRFPDVLPSAMVMVGDKVSTDGRFAEALGCRFAFVLSGVGHPDEAPEGASVHADLSSVIGSLIA